MRLINKAKALRIASEWHSGQWSLLYAFASSGKIIGGVSSEVGDTLNHLGAQPLRHVTKKEYMELVQLLRYLESKEFAGLE